MDAREKASMAWDAAFYLGEAALLLLTLGEVDLSIEAMALEKRVYKLEEALAKEADRIFDENIQDIRRTFEKGAL